MESVDKGSPSRGINLHNWNKEYDDEETKHKVKSRDQVGCLPGH